MSNFLTWIAYHRGMLIALIGLGFWIGANLLYARRDIQRIRRERSAHRWSADMATRTGKGGRTVSH